MLQWSYLRWVHVAFDSGCHKGSWASCFVFLLCPVSYATEMKLSFIWCHLNELVFQPRLYTSLSDIGSFSTKSFPCMQYWSWIGLQNPSVYFPKWSGLDNSSLGIWFLSKTVIYIRSHHFIIWHVPLSLQYVG